MKELLQQIRNGLQAITNPKLENTDGEVLTPEESRGKNMVILITTGIIICQIRNEMNPEISYKMELLLKVDVIVLMLNQNL